VSVQAIPNLIYIREAFGSNLNQDTDCPERFPGECRKKMKESKIKEGGIEYDRPCRSSAVKRWLPTAAARVRVGAACGICGGQSGTGAGFLRVLRFPLPIIPPISPLS
jgi:hypothetical protein